MANSAILAIRIIADAKGAQKGMAQAEASTSKFAAGMGKASRAATVGLAGLGALAVSAAKAAAEDAQSQAVLAQALKNTANATDDQIASTEAWITKTEFAAGVADDQLRPALANLVRATGSVSKAQKEMGLALDISAATGNDLGSVTAALAKAHAGNTTALGRLVPGLSKAVLKTKDMKKITAELARLVGGTSAKAADTAKGRYDRFKLALQETKESVGGLLLPAMTALLAVLLPVGLWATTHQTAFLAIAGALAGIAVAVYAVNAALKVYRATMVVIQAVQAATFLTNPVFLVIAAIVLLVVAIVLLWKRSEKFRKVVTGAFKAVQKAAKDTWAWIKTNWPKLVAVLFGPFGIAVALIVKNWDKIKAKASAVWTAIRTGVTSFLSWLTGQFNSAVGTITGFWNGLTSILTAPFNAVTSAVMTVVGWIETLIRKIKEIHFPSIGLPNIPGLSAAAPAPAPGLSRAARTGPATLSAGAGTVIHIHGALDPEAVARQLQRILGGHVRRVGTAPAI